MSATQKQTKKFSKASRQRCVFVPGFLVFLVKQQPLPFRKTERQKKFNNSSKRFTLIFFFGLYAETNQQEATRTKQSPKRLYKALRREKYLQGQP